MGLTATATKVLREEVHLLWQYPHQIMYLVKAEESLNVAFLPMLKQVQKEHTCFPEQSFTAESLVTVGTSMQCFEISLGRRLLSLKMHQISHSLDLLTCITVVWTPLLKTIIISMLFTKKSNLRVVLATIYCFWLGDRVPCM